LYCLLATEFLLRFRFQKPLKSGPSEKYEDEIYPVDDGKSSETVVGQNRGVISCQVSLMIIGLTLATLFVLMRYVVYWM
jgi:hypothetical protein